MDDMEKTEIITEPEENNDPDFTPITSQEQLNKIIGKRLERQREKIEREFAAKLEEAKSSATSEELEALKATTAEQEELLQLAKKENEELKAASAARDIKDLKLYNAQQYNIPIELLDNITGTTAEEIEASAQNLAQYAKKFRRSEPLFNSEPARFKVGSQRSVEDSYRDMLSDLRDQGLGDSNF